MNNKMKKILKWLKRHKACNAGYNYSTQFTDPADWWDSFDRGDWMLWVIWRAIDRKDEKELRKITLVKAKCANLFRHLMKDVRSKKAIDIALKYGKGLASKEELENAAVAAYAAAVAANADTAVAAYAANAAAVAAYAAAVAANADTAVTTYASANADTAYAAAVAAYASANADADAYDIAQKEILKKSADIVREHYSIQDVLQRILPTTFSRKENNEL